MALKSVRVGPFDGLYQYDDGTFDTAIETDQPISIGAPTDPGHAVRLQDLQDKSWPIGSVFLSVVSTDPATLLGFGTWARIAEGQMLVGFKTGDADFGTVEGIGGNKTITETTTSINNPASGTPTTVLNGPTNPSILNPYFTLYVWKRTA